MASFYVCHDQKTSFPTQLEDNSTINTTTACKILRKVALKLSEVPAKLDLSKVIRFLEGMQGQNQNHPRNTPQPNTVVKIKQSGQLMTFKQADNMALRTPSIMRISTCKSQMSFQQDKRLEQNQSLYKKLLNSQLEKQKTATPDKSNKQNKNSLLQSFQFREVVTKIALDQCEGNRKVKFKDGSDHQISIAANKQNLKMLQNLVDQHSKLKKLLSNIFKFFQKKGLFQPSLDPQLQSNQLLSKQLFANYDKREAQWQFQRKKLNEVKSEYLLTLKNISIDLRLETLKKNQTSIVHQQPNNPTFQLQHLSSRVRELAAASDKIEEMKSQISEMSQKMKQKQEAIQKYEMLLFIKEEEISSLRIMNSNLENRISKLAKTDDRPRSKSYKKYFQHLDQNLSATVS